MDSGVWQIFPPGSLAGSVTTTVWVGVMVTVAFNLRLGWVLSGLVVPGYIVPLMIVKPWAAAVIFVEGAVTYFIVLWLFEYLSAWGGWHPVFGRDRFFALLVVSVGVRLLFDTWLMPLLGEAVTEALHLRFDYQNHLKSIGLIVVALIANQFWKPGFFRGIVPVFATVGLTYLLVRYLLMPYTNYTLSGVTYLYEDIAASVLASPKAYIILLTTAFIASHRNLRFGWEYNGILIPSLIALLWYQPMKILVSLLEAFFILGIAMLVLRLSVFKQATIEGGRKILLFFNISFLYKFVLGYLILWWMPEKKITDYYGFGYLLPSLLAIKMHDKDLAVQLSRFTLGTSLRAVAIASLFGFFLSVVSHAWLLGGQGPSEVSAPPVRRLDTRLMELLQGEKVRMYRNRFEAEPRRPLSREIAAFSEAVRHLTSGAGDVDLRVENVRGWLAQAGYRVDVVEDRYLVLRDTAPGRNRGIYVIDTRSEARLGVQVPAPLEERLAMESGIRMFSEFSAGSLAIAGAESDGAGASDPLRSRRTFFHIFSRIAAPGDLIQVRTYTAQTLRALMGIRPDRTGFDLPPVESTLWVRPGLPQGVHLGVLKALIDDFRIEWRLPPSPGIYGGAEGREGFAEIFLNQQDVKKLFYRSFRNRSPVPLEVRDQRIDLPPKLEELLFFDREVLIPLLHILKTNRAGHRLSEEQIKTLGTVSSAADQMGYRVIRYRHRISGENYLILMEDEERPRRRYWGTYVFRLGEALEYIIQVPRPLFELHVFEYGTSFFERIRARALLIGGAHKRANRDGGADLLKIRNKENLFNLVHQVTMREFGAIPMMTLQMRARGVREGVYTDTDVLLAPYGGGDRQAVLSPMGRQIVDILSGDRKTFRFVDGSSETAGYEVGFTPQAQYLPETENKDFAIFWLSSHLRRNYRQQTENLRQAAQFAAVGIATEEIPLYTYLLDKAQWEKTRSIPPELGETIDTYTQYRDIIALRRLTVQWPRYRFRRIIDRNTRQSFLLVHTPASKLVFVANLSPVNRETRYTLSDARRMSEVVGTFIDGRAAALQY